MKSIVMIVTLLAAAILQAITQGWLSMGQAKPPLLLAIVLYYAMVHDRRLFIQAAIIGGLLYDCLGMTPLGYTSFCFCAIGFVASAFRDMVFIYEWVTHLIFGALASATLTLVLYVLLAKDSMVAPDPSWVALKVVGSAILGAMIVPLTFHIIDGTDRMLGNLEPAEV